MRNKKILEILKKTMLQVALPAFILMLVSQILVDWLNGQNDLLSCLLKPTIDVNNLFGELFNGKLQCLCVAIYGMYFRMLK